DSGKRKEVKAFTLYRMETEEVSERYITPCFVEGLDAYDGETNLEYEKNMISNEFAVKICLEYDFIINPEEDDVEPGVIFGRSFLRLTKGIVDFGNGILTIYPEGDCRKTFTLLFIPETPKNACQIHKSWEASASNIMKGSDK
ncbi:hypothetical protein Tco_1159454, partial [Tanacetum coccineum]